MIPIRSNLASYVAGITVIVLGLFMLVLPSFLIAVVNDLDISATATIFLLADALLGFPLIATGIVLTQKRYHLTLYSAVLTGIVYVATPLVLFGSLFPPYYIPAAIVFFVIILSLIFVATVRLSR